MRNRKDCSVIILDDITYSIYSLKGEDNMRGLNEEIYNEYICTLMKYLCTRLPELGGKGINRLGTSVVRLNSIKDLSDDELIDFYLDKNATMATKALDMCTNSKSEDINFMFDKFIKMLSIRETNGSGNYESTFLKIFNKPVKEIMTILKDVKENTNKYSTKDLMSLYIRSQLFIEFNLRHVMCNVEIGENIEFTMLSDLALLKLAESEYIAEYYPTVAKFLANNPDDCSREVEDKITLAIVNEFEEAELIKELKHEPKLNINYNVYTKIRKWTSIYKL